MKWRAILRLARVAKREQRSLQDLVGDCFPHVAVLPRLVVQRVEVKGVHSVLFGCCVQHRLVDKVLQAKADFSCHSSSRQQASPSLVSYAFYAFPRAGVREQRSGLISQNEVACHLEGRGCLSGYAR